MAPHSSTLTWKIPWMQEPGRLQSMGSLTVGHDWATSLSLFTFHFHALEKEMATHSSVLAWRIPGTGHPGGLLSMGLHRVRYDWSDSAAIDSIQKQRHYFANKGPSSQGYGFSCGHVWVWRLRLGRRLSAKELMLLNYGAGEDSWGSLGLQGDPTSPS